MSAKSLALASALGLAMLGLSGCVEVTGPYGYYDGYYTRPAFLGGYYRRDQQFRTSYGHYRHRYSHHRRFHRVGRRDGGRG